MKYCCDKQRDFHENTVFGDYCQECGYPDKYCTYCGKELEK